MFPANLDDLKIIYVANIDDEHEQMYTNTP